MHLNAWQAFAGGRGEDHAQSMHIATAADPHIRQSSWLSQSVRVQPYQDLCTAQPQLQVITCHDWAA